MKKTFSNILMTAIVCAIFCIATAMALLYMKDVSASQTDTDSGSGTKTPSIEAPDEDLRWPSRENSAEEATEAPREVRVTFSGPDGNKKTIRTRSGEEITFEDLGFRQAMKTLKGYADQNGQFYSLGSSATVKKDMSFTAAFELNNSFKVTIKGEITMGTGLYRVNLRDYIALDDLMREGATRVRISWTQSASSGDKGNCIPSVDIYCGEPKTNRNVFVMDHYQVASYTSEKRIFSVDFDHSTKSFSTKAIDLNQMIEEGKICIDYKALAAFPGDVLKNSYYVDAVFTIEVF